MFRQDIEVQGRKLMDMLTALVGHLEQFEELTPMLKAIGQRHAGDGMKTEHYATVASALTWATAIALEGQFSPELKAAWRAVIDAVAEVMMDGAAELPPG